MAVELEDEPPPTLDSTENASATSGRPPLLAGHLHVTQRRSNAASLGPESPLGLYAGPVATNVRPVTLLATAA